MLAFMTLKPKTCQAVTSRTRPLAGRTKGLTAAGADDAPCAVDCDRPCPGPPVSVCICAPTSASSSKTTNPGPGSREPSGPGILRFRIRGSSSARPGTTGAANGTARRQVFWLAGSSLRRAFPPACRQWHRCGGRPRSQRRVRDGFAPSSLEALSGISAVDPSRRAEAAQPCAGYGIGTPTSVATCTSEMSPVGDPMPTSATTVAAQHDDLHRAPPRAFSVSQCSLFGVVHTPQCASRGLADGGTRAAGRIRLCYTRGMPTDPNKAVYYRKQVPLFRLVEKMKLWPSRRGMLHGIKEFEVLGSRARLTTHCGKHMVVHDSKTSRSARWLRNKLFFEACPQCRIPEWKLQKYAATSSSAATGRTCATTARAASWALVATSVRLRRVRATSDRGGNALFRAWRRPSRCADGRRSRRACRSCGWAQAPPSSALSLTTRSGALLEKLDRARAASSTTVSAGQSSCASGSLHGARFRRTRRGRLLRPWPCGRLGYDLRHSGHPLVPRPAVPWRRSAGNLGTDAGHDLAQEPVRFSKLPPYGPGRSTHSGTRGPGSRGSA